MASYLLESLSTLVLGEEDDNPSCLKVRGPVALRRPSSPARA